MVESRKPAGKLRESFSSFRNFYFLMEKFFRALFEMERFGDVSGVWIFQSREFMVLSHVIPVYYT